MRLLLFFILLLLLAGCAATPELSVQQLQDAVTAITADGVVSEQERSALASLAAPGVDWAAVTGTVAASFVSSLIGVKLLPSTLFRGPFDPKPQQAG